MAGNESRLSRLGSRLPRNPVWQFALSVLLAAVLVGAGSAYFFRKAGTDQATKQARVVTATIARTAIEPALSDGIVNGDPKALTALDRAVRRYVVRGDVVRVKLWTADGRVVYSDEPAPDRLGLSPRRGRPGDDRDRQVVGRHQRPEEAREPVRARIRKALAGVPARQDPGRPAAPLRDVPEVQLGHGQRLRPLGRLPADPARRARRASPIVQLSLAWSLTRRLRSGQQERERLLLRSIQASNTERRRIAADLHDTVVQDLAGVSLSLGAAAGRAAQRGGPRRARARRGRRRGRASAACARCSSTSTRRASRPRAAGGALRPARAARERQIEATLDVQESLELEPAAEQLVFRCAQEALRNVAAHSGATHASVTCPRTARTAPRGSSWRTTARASRRRTSEPQAGGHFGMTLLADAAADFGAKLEIDSAPGRGTRIVLEVPTA